MRLRTILQTLLVGAVTALCVGVVVTELVSPYVEFSLFVGIPVGALAGLASVAVVAQWLESAALGRRAIALGLVAFAATLVVVLAFAVGVADLSNTDGLVVAAVAGVVLGSLRYLRARAGEPTVAPPSRPH